MDDFFWQFTAYHDLTSFSIELVHAFVNSKYVYPIPFFQILLRLVNLCSRGQGGYIEGTCKETKY